ncbi:site-2 protease family protein [Amphibacillus indicireducens]|uniref:Peptidase M50 domain-containing protein n=1 Tax=Amphibacillus indicireducens TaxID=1076330 RepID=A0ABP7W1W3_9BACI
MIIIELYIYYIISSFIHELGHFITLKLFGVKVTRFSIGNFFHFNIGKLKLSPIILTAFIEFPSKEFSKLTLAPKLIIISSGALMNLLTYFLFPENKILHYS